MNTTPPEINYNKINYEKIENESKTVEKTAIDLENLTKKYSITLTQYQQSVADYNNYIQQQSQTQNTNQTFNTISNQAFWGSSAISQASGSSIQDCQASCSNTKGCSGATFNSETQTCYLRSGEGSIIPSSANDTAIVPESTLLLSNMEQLNKQLISINQQIQETIESSQKDYNSLKDMSNEINTKALIKNYEKLMKERKNILLMVNENLKLNQDEFQGGLTVNKNYYSFILLLFVVIVIIIIIYKMASSSTNLQNIQRGGELGSNSYYIIYLIVMLVLTIYIYNYFTKF